MDGTRRFDAPPTLDELEAAGVPFVPLDGDDEDGLEIARANGYVILRHPSIPHRALLITDEDAWDAGDPDAHIA